MSEKYSTRASTRSKRAHRGYQSAFKGRHSFRRGGNKARSLCYDLLERFETLWTFLYIEGVEPTNNLAERALRPMVIWRKLSGGTQSEWGNRLNERLQTVVFTLKQRMQNVFEYLTSRFQEFIRAGPISVNSWLHMRRLLSFFMSINRSDVPPTPWTRTTFSYSSASVFLPETKFCGSL